MGNFAKIEDLELLWRSLKFDERARAEALLEVVSNSLRVEAEKVGKDLDDMVAESVSFASVAKSVTVDIVARTLMTSTDHEPMTQVSESALGYSFSGSYLVPGGGLFIKDTELKRHGLKKKQRYGAIEIYDLPKRNPCHFVLVAPTSSEDVINQMNVTGKKAEYTLGIPKGDTNKWENRDVKFFGRKWRTIGIPQEGIESMIPLSWNRKVMVEVYE